MPDEVASIDANVERIVNAAEDAVTTLAERARTDIEIVVERQAARRELLLQIREIDEALRAYPQFVAATWQWLDLTIKRYKVEQLRSQIAELEGGQNGEQG